MQGVRTEERTELSISSVRSSVSTASSGFAVVSARAKARKSVQNVYPEEPPPDYDDELSIDLDPVILSGNVNQTPPSRRLPVYPEPADVHRPLIKQKTAPLESYRQFGSAHDTTDCSQSHLLPQDSSNISIKNSSDRSRQVVRINSRTGDLNIEIETAPCGSPYSPNNSESPFIYKDKAKRKCCPCLTLKQKFMIAVIVIVVLVVTLLALVLNFTVCISRITTACTG